MMDSLGLGFIMTPHTVIMRICGLNLIVAVRTRARAAGHMMNAYANALALAVFLIVLYAICH
jgi:hypothetical protein